MFKFIISGWTIILFFVAISLLPGSNGGVAFMLALYFLPTIAAVFGNRNAAAIFLLNLFLGWTMIGWIVALIWACTTRSHDHSEIVKVKVV